jgi:hypothetical protein
MGKSKTPTIQQPDPYATAQAQAGANKDAIEATAQYNQIQQKNPLLHTYYTGQIGSNDRTKVDSYDPRLIDDLNRDLNTERIKDNQVYARISNLPYNNFSLPKENNTIKQLDFGNVPAMDVNASADARNNVIDTLYGEFTRRNDDRFNRDESKLRSYLLNQGAGNEANTGYRNAINDFRQNKDDAYQSAMTNAVVQGGTEQNRLVGLGQSERSRVINEQLQDATLRAQARASGINEDLTGRNQNINELASLVQGAGAVSVPQLSSPTLAGSVAPADISGNIYSNANAQNQAALQRAQSNSAKAGNLTGAVGGIGAGYAGSAAGSKALGSLFSFSSKDYKTKTNDFNKDDALEALRKLPVDRWRYKDVAMGEHEEIGMYAEDFNGAFGLEHNDKISVTSALGVMVAAIQSLADKVEALQNGN